MPELPEVETVARQLAPAVTGRTIRKLEVLDALLEAKQPTPSVAGRRIDRVYRLGKQVVFDLPDARGNPLHLAVHLRMTGRLQCAGPGVRSDRTHLRARFALDRGALLFYDTRRFGTFRWTTDLAEAQPEGIDPTTAAFNARSLARQLERSDQNLKVWLLRQDRLVGLGNIYASEILHVARLSPHRTTRSLDPAEIGRLARATRSVLKRAIEACGTTFSDFQDAYGVTGSYQQYLRVYDRDGERCRRCPGTIQRIVQAQRSTYFCESCQD